MKTVHNEEQLRWHLENNIQPPLTSKAIEGILQTIADFNNGLLELDAFIDDENEITVREMFYDLKIEISSYEQQAINFLNSTSTEFKCEFIKNSKHFSDDKETRDIYKITLTRKNRSYTFDFGNSINDSGFKLRQGSGRIINIPTSDSERALLLKNRATLKRLVERTIKFNLNDHDKILLPKEPTAYSVLACLTKYNPGTLEDFCSEFGYATDSKKADIIYNAVKDEFLHVISLFNESELEQLQEIQ